MSTIEIIIGIVILIPLVFLLFLFNKIKGNPLSKSNYIVMKYRLKEYNGYELSKLLEQDDKEVPKRDKIIIKQLLSEDF